MKYEGEYSILLIKSMRFSGGAKVLVKLSEVG